MQMCHGATTSAEVSLVEEGEEDSSEETSEVVTPEDEESDRFFFFPRFKCNVVGALNLQNGYALC